MSLLIFFTGYAHHTYAGQIEYLETTIEQITKVITPCRLQNNGAIKSGHSKCSFALSTYSEVRNTPQQLIFETSIFQCIVWV